MSSVDDAQQLMRMAPLPPLANPNAPPASGAPAAAALGAGDILRVLKQRKLMITISFCVLYMLVVAATFLIWRFAPQYTSTAYIRFVPPAVDPFSMIEAQPAKDYVDNSLATEASGLVAPDSLLDVLKQEEIKATQFCQWYGTDEKGQNECLEDLKKYLAPARVRDSFLISVSFAAKSKADATKVVNTLVRRYVERRRSAVGDQGRSKLNTLKQTRAAVEEQLEQVRTRIADLRAARDMPALESERDVQTDVISMLNNTRAELLARQADIEAQLENVHGQDPRNLPLSSEMKVAIDNDPELRNYRQSVEQIDVQINVLQQHLIGPNHPNMRMLHTQRDEYARKEAARREELIDTFNARQVESLEQERARIRNTLAEVQEQLTERENQQRDLDAAITRLESLQKDEQRYDDELKEVSLRVREAEQQQNVQAQQGQLEVYALAKDAIWPTRPQPVLYLGGGLALSLLVAVGLAFLREFTDQSVRTPLDIVRHAHLSVLGCVPRLDDEEADVAEIELATRSAPQSLIAEAFRQIRAHLVFSGPAESQHALLITSPRPEDGKTAMAVNLAVTFTHGQQSVLLIDCNFRRPCMRSEVAFPRARAEGLSNILVGRARLADVVNPTDVPGLAVLTSGPMPPNPAELLGSTAMRALLAEARQKYDRVILDGPPCLLISDALVLAMQVDATVLVARAGVNTKGTLRRAREQLQRLNVRVIGAILNGVRAQAGGYFRQQYREFYEYTNEEVVAQQLDEAAPPALEAGSSTPPPDERV